MFKLKRSWLKIFCFLCLITLVFGCQKKKSASILSGLHSKEIGVDVFIVKRVSSIPVFVEYPGMTRSFKKAIVRARVSGILENRYFKEGDYVKKGQELFSIEKNIYLAKYQAAKAAVLQAKAQLEQATKTWKRVWKSYQAHLVSDETKDNALAKYKLAKAAYKLAKARLKEAEIYLNYTDVKAPISGYTCERRVDVGNLVAPGTPLVEIDEINPIYVDFSIPDKDVIKFDFLNVRSSNYIKRLKVKLSLSDNKTISELGKIDYVAPILDKGIPVLRIRAVFRNSRHQILPNLFVRVQLVGIKKKNAIIVPKKCVLYAPEGPKVYVVKNGEAEEKFIKLDGEYKEFYIVKSGLNPGEMVITDNLMKITSGSKVKIESVIGK